MSRICDLVGVVVDGTLVEDRVVNGEVFYTIKVEFVDVEIPLLFSAYNNTTVFENGTKIRVKGCFLSDVKEQQLPKSYIYATSIEIEDIDAEPSKEINFSCTVTKVKDGKVDHRCNEVITLVASDMSPLDTITILSLSVRGAYARRLKGRKKGYAIKGCGNLKKYRDIHQIDVTEITNMDEIFKDVKDKE